MPGSNPWPTFSALVRSTKAGKAVGDRLLDEYSVGADAGLTTDPQEFHGDRSIQGGVEIRVIKDDEWSVASELKRDPLDLFSGLLHQALSYVGRTRETDLLDQRIGK